MELPCLAIWLHELACWLRHLELQQLYSQKKATIDAKCLGINFYRSLVKIGTVCGIQGHSRGLKQAVKTGSTCCVAARPLEPTDNRNAWSNGHGEPHWSSNGNFSPLTVHWGDKDLPRNLAGAAHDFQFHRTSFSSSSRCSRSGSRAGSSRYIGDQRNFSGCMYSQAESPLNSFRASHWNPLASSQMDQMSDYNNTPSDTISSPTVTVASSKEACLSDTNTPESTPLYSSTGESLQTTVEQGFSQLQLGGSHSFSSKSLPPVGSHALSRNVSDSRIHATTLGSNRNAMSEARHSFRWSDRGGELSGNTSDWWSMRTFSELVASSRRERPRWVNASSPSDFGFVPERVSTDRAESVMERIRASGPPSASMSPQSEVLTCGLCSRWLSQRSPLSPQKLIANNDLAVVGVLSCGHVFHAECLEQATPKEGAHDPPCPQCHALETLSSRRCSLESVASKSVMKSSFQGQSSSRNKLSRIGIMTDDISVEISSDANHANIKNSSCSQGTGDKVVSQMSSLMEKSSLSRSLSRTFSFRGKGMKDSISSDLNLKKKGLPYPTSPDNHPREDQSKATHLRRAFKHLQVPRR